MAKTSGREGPQTTRRLSTANGRRVYLGVILGYALMLPPQLNANFLGSVFPPYRILLMVMSLYILSAIFRRQLKPTWADGAVLAATGWICAAMFVSSDTQQAITASLAHIVDVAIAYFLSRAIFRNIGDLRAFLLLMLPGLLIVGTIIMVEAITHTHIIQGIFSELTGHPVQYGSSPRFGLMRAQGPFPHPILAGIFFVSFLPLYWLAGYKKIPRMSGSFAALTSFFSVSSATLLGLVASIGLLVYSWMTKRVANITWPLFFFAASIVIFVAELGTKSGTFSLFVRFASLNSMGAYNRILIWDYGTENVARNPWFGIGYADWVRPDWMSASMDNYWLLLAVRFGLPASILVAVAVLIGISSLMQRSIDNSVADADVLRGVAISLGVFALGLASVSLWLAVQVWFFALLGIAVSLGQADARKIGRVVHPMSHDGIRKSNSGAFS
ncbi:O-antigen ligase family protein [Aurantiacibacter aquimixticola]|nr:O-antigen ligase family protein [Aurantiacibacter aquimixticola]